MPGIDYSKWDKLVDSDDDEPVAPSRPFSTSAPEADEDSSDNDLDGEIAMEDAELAEFVREHPCPPEGKVLEWLRDAVQNGTLDKGPQPLSDVLHQSGIMESASDALIMFSYNLYKKLYEAPLLNRDEKKKAEKEVGVALNSRGGMPCMRLHSYMINYAMCGQYFFGNVRRPAPVMCYINHIDHVWTGIGDWVA